MKRIILLFVVILLLIGILLSYFFLKSKKLTSGTFSTLQKTTPQNTNKNPLSIEAMRAKNYPGSNIVIEQTLSNGSNYKQYVVSYQSDGLKIHALLTIPIENPPSGGFPAIVFNHGYIQPEIYKTTERYIAYVDAFATNGYVVFKPDYRGNGNSEGVPESAYYSPAYATDDLNAIASVKKLSYINPNKMGVWGHSMGGNITLRDIVVEPNWVKAAVIWGGVVGSYPDLLTWHDPHYQPSAEDLALRNKHKDDIIKQYGIPQTNPTFWQSIDPTYYVKDITVPVQLHMGGADEEVPASFSAKLYTNLVQNKKVAEYYIYPGNDHNISQSFNLAMERSLAFFDKYVKGNK